MLPVSREGFEAQRGKRAVAAPSRGRLLVPVNATIYIVKKDGDAKLGIMARPRGGDWLEDDLAGIARQGFDVIVSLLEEEEQTDLELGSEPQESQKAKLEFVNIPIPDRGTPVLDDTILTAISSLSDRWRSGKSLAIHCRMAYGRAPMIAICILVSQAECAENAIATVSAARGVSVPETPEQLAWIHGYEQIIRAR